MTLRELHDAVKSHPYRMEFKEEHLSDYRKLLYTLSGVFFDNFKQSEQCKKAKYPPYSFEHDFNSAIYSFEKDTNSLAHVETCIGIIHRYIDTGVLNEYYTYYGGCNILKALPRRRKHIWNKENKYWVSQFTKEQLQNAVEEIEQYVDSHNGVFEKWGHRSKTNYDYFKEKLKELSNDE